MTWDLVVVCPSGGQLAQLESAVRAVASLDSDPLAGRRVAAVTWSDDAAAPDGIEVIRVEGDGPPPAPTAHAVVRVLRRLGPADEGTRFLRAVLRDDAATAALDSARVIAALERDAVWTVWRWGRRRPDAHVVLGLTAGLHRLAQD